MLRSVGRTDYFCAMVSSALAGLVAILILIPLITTTGLASRPPLVVLAGYMVFWPAYVLLYLTWSYRTYSLLRLDQLRALARYEERGQRSLTQRLTGATGFFNTVIGAASSAIIVLGVIAGRDEFRGQLVYLVLGLLTVASSWILMVHYFAQSYLRLDSTAPGRHLTLAVTDGPRFEDFLSISIMVSTMGASVPAQPRSREAWRLLRTNTLGGSPSTPSSSPCWRPCSWAASPPSEGPTRRGPGIITALPTRPGGDLRDARVR